MLKTGMIPGSALSNVPSSTVINSTQQKTRAGMALTRISGVELSLSIRSHVYGRHGTHLGRCDRLECGTEKTVFATYPHERRNSTWQFFSKHRHITALHLHPAAINAVEPLRAESLSSRRSELNPTVDQTNIPAVRCSHPQARHSPSWTR
jgi:hypothetical protein